MSFWGGLFSLFGQRHASRASRSISERELDFQQGQHALGRQFQAEEAHLDRAFQSDMFKRANQRADTAFYRNMSNLLGHGNVDENGWVQGYAGNIGLDELGRQRDIRDYTTRQGIDLDFYNKRLASEVPHIQKRLDMQSADYHRRLGSQAAFNRINARDILQTQFDVGRSQGLTPQESLGLSPPGGGSGGSSGVISASGPSGGSGGSGGGAVLGQTAVNASAQQQQSQDRAQDRMFQARIAESNNRTQLQIAQTQAGAQLSAARLQAGASSASDTVRAFSAAGGSIQSSLDTLRGQDISSTDTRRGQDLQRQTAIEEIAVRSQLSYAQISKLHAEIDTLDTERFWNAIKFDERWANKFSGMSRENVLTSAYAYLSGIPLEDILKGNPGIRPGAVRDFANSLIGDQSGVVSNFTGFGSILQRLGRGALGRLNPYGPNN